MNTCSVWPQFGHFNVLLSCMLMFFGGHVGGVVCSHPGGNDKGPSVNPALHITGLDRESTGDVEEIDQQNETRAAYHTLDRWDLIGGPAHSRPSPGPHSAKGIRYPWCPCSKSPCKASRNLDHLRACLAKALLVKRVPLTSASSNPLLLSPNFLAIFRPLWLRYTS